MRVRNLLVLLVIVAVGVGAFFGGRASVSSTPSAATSTHLVTAQFRPLSASFISADVGWAFGSAPCTSTRKCLALLRTSDGGLTWTVVPIPEPLVRDADRATSGTLAVLSEFEGLNVRFANSNDGWIYGSLYVPDPALGSSDVQPQPVLWSTHDGGASWHQLPLGWVGEEGTIFDLETAGGMAYLAGPNKAFDTTIESSPIGSNRWHATNTVRLGSPAGGGQPTGSIVLKGAQGWFVGGNDRGTSASARLASNGSWVAWTPPCSTVGGSFAVPAASTPSDLVAVCTMGGYASSLSRSAPPGAKLGSNWLYFSDDDGKRFAAGPELRPVKPIFDSGNLTSPSPNVLLLGRYAGNGEVLIGSFDGGIHWSVVCRRGVFNLEFTSPTQGFGLVRSYSGSTVTSMIMTSDGGRRWSTVNF